MENLEIDNSKNLVYNFFLNRFGPPESNQSYFRTWVRRFEKFSVERCIAEMDGKSFEVFVKVATEMRNK